MIEKLTLNIDGKQIELTIEEAGILKMELDNLFSNTVPTYIPNTFPNITMPPSTMPFHTYTTCRN